MKKLTKKQKQKLLLGIILVLIVGAGAYLITLSPLQSIIPSTTKASTFKLISYVDGEDVSDFVEISIWTPDPNKDIEETEDIYTLTNFEEDVGSKDAEDISIDLSGYQYVWVEIDPDGSSVFSNNFHLITGGSNKQYTFYVYHLSSDVNFNILNVTDMKAWDKETEGNYTLYLDFPHYTTANKHAGDGGWNIDADEFAELTQSELEDLYNEQNYRCQAPLYNPASDTEKDYVDDLERLTSAFAIRFTMNTTVSKVDGNSAQVNVTLADENDDCEVVVSGEYVFLIFTNILKAPYDISFEIELGSAIKATTVQSGRVAVPQDEDNLGSFTAYSAIAS